MKPTYLYNEAAETRKRLFCFARKNNRNIVRALYARCEGSEKQGLSPDLPKMKQVGIRFKKNVNIKNIQNENERKREKTRDIIKNR